MYCTVAPAEFVEVAVDVIVVGMVDVVVITDVDVVVIVVTGASCLNATATIPQ